MTSGSGHWTARDIEILNTWQLLTAKPVVYLVNVSAKDYVRKKNKWLAKIFEWVQAHGGTPFIPFSGAFENEVRLRGVAQAQQRALGQAGGAHPEATSGRLRCRRPPDALLLRPSVAGGTSGVDIGGAFAHAAHEGLC